MKHYIGVKMIQAEPMKLSEFAILKENPLDEGTEDCEGYRVLYPSGVDNWFPKEVFDAAYLELENESTISENDINRFVGPHAFAAETLDNKTTLVRVIPRTGFLMYETSSCVDPKNYNEVIGNNICLGKIKDRLWGHMGFVLQWALNGLRPFNEPPDVSIPNPAEEPEPDSEPAIEADKQ